MASITPAVATAGGGQARAVQSSEDLRIFTPGRKQCIERVHDRRNRCPPGRPVRGLSLPAARPARRGEAPDRRQPEPSARGRPVGVRRPPAALARRCAPWSPAAAPAMPPSCWPPRWRATAGPARVTYLDRSDGGAAHRPGARRGARPRRTSSGSSGSLLDLPGGGLGPFDYIDCCGVLHHLPDPAAGLRRAAVGAGAGRRAWG